MKILLTGSTGMVGRSVLNECLESDTVSEIVLINRKSLNLKHPKVREILLPDFSDIENIKNELPAFDACFYCMGVSALGLNEEKYSQITYENTKAFADVMYDINPQMVFNYVSGTGTDSTEQGSIMWARIKGKTENMVFNKGFKDAYAFRPGVIIPEKGVKSSTNWYNIFYVLTKPLFPIIKRMNSVTTSSKIGQAMINTVLHPQNIKILENRDINQLA